MAYHEEPIAGRTDANGACTIQLGPILQIDDVYFLGYVTAECADGSSANYRLVNPKTSGKLGGFAGQMAVVGPMYIKPQEFMQLVVNNGPPNTAITGSIIGDVHTDYTQLQLRPVPTAAGANVTLPSFPTITVTGLADLQGDVDVGGSARFKGPDPWYDVTHPDFAGGAVGDGVHRDDPMILIAISAAGTVGPFGASGGGWVLCPPGAYLIEAGLTLSANGVVLTGVGYYASMLRVSTAAGFASTFWINVSGATHCAIRNLGFVGADSTYSNNPAADALLLNNGANGTRLEELAFFYVNGWCWNIVPKADGTTTFATFVANVHTRLVKQGMYIKGGSTSLYATGFHASNVLFDTCIGGEAVYIDDASDCVFAATQGQNTGGAACIHIRGRSTSIFFATPDYGGSQSFASPSLLIEANGGNSPKYIKFVGGTISAGTPGISVSAGTQIKFIGVDISFNNGSGAVISGGDLIGFMACDFQGNNTSLAANQYDLNVSTAVARVYVDAGCTFDSPDVLQAVNHNTGLRISNTTANLAASGYDQLFLGSGAVASSTVTLGAEGADANITINVQPKGTGGVRLGAQLANRVMVSPAATGVNPTIAAEGTDAAIDLGLVAKGARSFFFSNSAADYLQLTPQAGVIEDVAAGGSANIDRRFTPKGTGVVDLNYATVALGGGAAPTLGTIGGTGPAAAAQNSWLKVKIAGTVSYVPVWR